MRLIDYNKKLLTLRFSNRMLILPYYYGRIMSEFNNQKFSGDNIKRESFFKIFINLFKALIRIYPKKADVLALSNSRWEKKIDGKWMNIQHGYYSNLFSGRFLLIEEPIANYTWKTFSTSCPLSTISIYISAFSFLISKFVYVINYFFINKKDFYEFNKIFPSIEIRELIYRDFYVRAYYFLWKLLLKYIKPKVILLHCGSYGSNIGIICKIAHELNIKTIDTQHGQVYNHRNYVAPPFIYNSDEYMLYMPDYFYSFGEFWSKCVNWSYEKIEVGNPHLNTYVKMIENTPKKFDFLIISQPNEKEQQRIFIKRLSKHFFNKKIKIRLHPYDNVELETKYYADFPNVVVMKADNNLYVDMAEAEFVVGWSSTCLAELVAFGRVPFIVNSHLSDNFPKELGIVVDSPEDIEKQINTSRSNVDPNIYWFQYFEKTVLSHMSSLL